MKRSSSLTSTVALVAALVLVLLLLLTGLSSEPTSLSGPLTVAILGATIAALWASRRERLRAENRLRAQAIEAALAKERLSIARELHDIVSHGLALVTMRASVARYATPHDADALEEALSDIEETSRATTRDLRTMLQALRTESSDAPAPHGQRPDRPGASGPHRWHRHHFPWPRRCHSFAGRLERPTASSRRR